MQLSKQVSSNDHRRSASLAIPVAGLLAFGAATAGPLDQFARDNGGTPVQVGIAEAIQNICPQLVGTFGGDINNALSAPTSARKDITLRCNELIGTAVDLGGGSPPRSLNVSSNELLAALQQVTGEEVASQNTMTVRAANGQFSNIAARLGAVRFAAGGAGSTGPASAFNIGLNGADLSAALPQPVAERLGGGASADEPAGLKRLGFFINGSYNTGDRDPSRLEDGFDFDVFSGTAGLDYRFNTGVLGVSLGYDSFDADFEVTNLVAGGKVEATGFSGSVFALKEVGNFFIDGIATYGQLDYDIDRILRYQSANSDPGCQCGAQDRTIVSESDGDHMTLSVNAGWMWYADAWIFQPTLGLSFRNYEIDGYTERDSSQGSGMELRYGDQDVDSLRSILGIQISRASNRSFGVLRPWLNLEWYHEFEDDPNTLAAKYAQEDALANSGNFPGSGFSSSLTGCLSCFTLAGEEPDSDYGVVGAGLSFVFPNFVQLLFYYEGLVGYRDLTSHAFTVNFRRQF